MVIILFNLFYFLLLLLGLGCFWFFDYGLRVFNFWPKRCFSSNDKSNSLLKYKNIRATRNKIGMIQFILFICISSSTAPLFIINNHDFRIFLLYLFILFIFSLFSPLRNLIMNLAIRLILREGLVAKLITKGTNAMRRSSNQPITHE